MNEWLIEWRGMINEDTLSISVFWDNRLASVNYTETIQAKFFGKKNLQLAKLVD